MKSFKATWVFLLFVAAFAGYTFWEYKKAGGDTDTPQEKKLFTFKNEEVEQLKIVKDGQTFEVVRDHDGWKMKQPIEDLVEPSAMDAALYSILVQKGKVFRTEEDGKGAIKWADFGLEPPKAVVELKTAKSTQTLQVSSKNAFDGSFYLRQGDELFLGDHGMAQAVLREPVSFRTKRLWRDPDGKIETIDVQINADKLKDKYTLKRDGENWKLDPAPAYPVDKAKLEAWVTSLQSLHGTDIVSDTLDDKVKHEDLLLKPSLVVTVNSKKPDGKPDTWVLTAGQDRAEDVFLYSSLRPTVYKAPHASADRLRVPQEYFRDGKKPFQFPVDQVHLIEVHNGPLHQRFKKTDLLWKLEGDDKVEVNQDKLITLMENLAQLDAQIFVPKASAKGFKPDQRIVLYDANNKPVFDLSWGDEFKGQYGYNKGMTFRYVKTNLEAEAMGLTASKVVSLIEKDMVKAKAAAPPPPVPGAPPPPSVNK